MDNQQEKKLVWLDCDPGSDDAIAIFLAGKCPALKLLGVSTVQGNTHVDHSTKNALCLLKMAGIEGVQVYKGFEGPMVRQIFKSDDFHGQTGIGECVFPEPDQQAITEDVINKIYQIIISQDRKIHFIATGAMTNLGALLNMYPKVKNHIEQITIMGGSTGFGNVTPAAEFNIYMDPEAANIVFECGLPLVMVPLDLTLKVKVDQNVLAKINAFNSNFSKNVVLFLNFYLQSYKQVFDFDYAALHDPCAVYYIINPSAFKTKLRNVVIEMKSEFCDGRTVVDEFSVTGRKPNCIIAYDMDHDQFWNEMMLALNECNKSCCLN